MLIAAITTQSGIYKFVLVLHILCAIVGFGAVLLNGVYGAQARKRPGPGGLAVTEANEAASKVGEYFIYAVFVLGMALVGMSDKAWKFDQAWLPISVVLYIIGLGVAHGVLIRGQKRMIVLQRELVSAPAPASGGAAAGPPPQVAEMEAISKRLAAAGAFNQLVLVVILFMMVYKPGV
jgi:hypothetical protein